MSEAIVAGTNSAEGFAPLTPLQRFDRWRDDHRDLGLTAILVMQSTIIFLMVPMAVSGLLNKEVVQLARIAMATTAVLIVNRYHPFGIAAALLFLTSLVCSYYARTGIASDAIYLFKIAITIMFDVSVTWILAQAVFGSGRVTVHRIMGAVVLYLYVGMIFAALFHFVDAVFYQSFATLSKTKISSSSEYLYYSMGALTTAGSGHISPIHPFARSLAMLESVIGQLYPATFIARLITLHGSVVEGRGSEKSL